MAHRRLLLITQKLSLIPILWAFQTPSQASIGSCEYTIVNTSNVSFSGASSLPTLNGMINNELITMLLDTGSSLTYVMPHAAEKLNLRIGKSASTANGIGGVARRAVTKLDTIRIGPILSEKPYLFVLYDLGFTPFFDAILGADYLFSMDLQIDLRARKVDFLSANECQTYAKPTWSYSEIKLLEISDDDRLQFLISVNGIEVRAIIDTAAAHSLLDRKAAIRLGFNIDSSTKKVTKLGVGINPIDASRIVIEKLIIGSATYTNFELDVSDLPEMNNDSPELILGKEFLLNHIILVSKNNHRLFVSNPSQK